MVLVKLYVVYFNIYVNLFTNLISISGIVELLIIIPITMGEAGHLESRKWDRISGIGQDTQDAGTTPNNEALFEDPGQPRTPKNHPVYLVLS